MLPGIAVLMVALCQTVQEPPPKIAIVENDQPRIIFLYQARAQHARLSRLKGELSPEDRALLAALDTALGTLPSKPANSGLLKHDLERERFQRQPLQGVPFGGDP